ncbi:MAG: hypothetical protein AAGK04_09030 [Planctomycetota bacterium]
MGALPQHNLGALGAWNWQAEILQLMDESHLVAWSEDESRRLRFATHFGRFLQAQRDTEVCVLYGRTITDIDSLCYQLERMLPLGPIERRIDGARGVTGRLRARADLPGHPPTKFRYYLWHDADNLLQHNPVLFGRVADALAGVAAEAEYVSDDLLLLHRTVFVGGGLLDRYADSSRGQFRSWFDDGKGEPFWRVVTGIESPSFTRYPLDQLDAVAEPAEPHG